MEKDQWLLETKLLLFSSKRECASRFALAWKWERSSGGCR